MESLFKELGYPGQHALFAAAKQRGLKVSKDEVRRLVMSNQAKQTLGQPQETLGKTAAPDTIWQADLAEFFHDTDNPDAKFVLVVVNLTDRKLYTRPMPDKRPITVRDAMKSIMGAAPEAPKIISHDQGQEFISPTMARYLDNLGIAQRYKYKDDLNGLGLIDSMISSLKKKLAVIVQTEGGDWGTQLARATKALNNTPKDYLHGETPNSVKDSATAKFMLLQDNARFMKHNHDLAQKRIKALNQSKNAFRAPLKLKRWHRGFRAYYGPIQRASDIGSGWVTSYNGNKYDLKFIKPVTA